MIDVDAFRAAAQRQEERLAPPATTFTITLDADEAATVHRLAIMAGVSPQVIAQRLATAFPFRAASTAFRKGWTYTCPETGRALPSDMGESQDYWCAAVLSHIGLSPLARAGLGHP